MPVFREPVTGLEELEEAVANYAVRYRRFGQARARGLQANNQLLGRIQPQYSPCTISLDEPTDDPIRIVRMQNPARIDLPQGICQKGGRALARSCFRWIPPGLLFEEHGDERGVGSSMPWRKLPRVTANLERF